MPCAHPSGDFQLFTYGQGQWFSRCLLCGAQETADSPGYLEEAGAAALTGFLRHGQRRFPEAAKAFAEAADISGDARYRLASLLCRCGVTWCGDERQPTFGVSPLPACALQHSPEWQAVEQRVADPDDAAHQSLCRLMAQLDEILESIHAREGLSACDVFLCYRRTSANVQSALQLCRDLTASGLRVFCADVTTRGKTQEQFESEVYHALNTAEYLVLLPGEGEDALTPWLRNELERAACGRANRMVCSTGHNSIPAEVAALGECLPLEEIHRRLIAVSAGCTAGRLYERAMTALRSGAAPQASALLQRASAAGSVPARLLAAELYGEGLVLPADAQRTEHFRLLAGDPAESVRRQVSDDFIALEKALNIVHRQALIYLVADVSDAGFAVSQPLARAFVAALNGDRLLAASHLCFVGYDRHARILSEPKALIEYGTPSDAARTLRTCREDGCDRAAYAAKGLRCAADHLHHTSAAQGRTPVIVLLRPCPTSDSPAGLQAATLTAQGLLPGGVQELSSADALSGCISSLRAQLQ